MIKKFLGLSFILGGCHFLISAILVPFTLWVGNTSMAGTVKGPVLTILHLGTKIFYFPILSLALYPRYWFPGPWIHLPVLANSMLWGALIAAVLLCFRKRSKKGPEIG